MKAGGSKTTFEANPSAIYPILSLLDSMSKEEQERREVLALVSWLQTFDQFPFSVVDGIDVDNVKERFNIVIESLENVKISW